MNARLHYATLIERARQRQRPIACEDHHVIPRCMGGLDVEENRAALTPEEHYVAHQLLIRIYPDEPKLVYAAFMMSLTNRYHHRRGNRPYGWIRRKMATQQRGRKHSLGHIEKIRAKAKRPSDAALAKTLAKIQSPEYRAAASARRALQAPDSDETRLRKSLAQKGKSRPRSVASIEAHRKAMGAAETRANMSSSRRIFWARVRAGEVAHPSKGRKRTVAQCERLSAARKKDWERRKGVVSCPVS